MSKADEMFEKLGYKLTDEKICPHSYRYIKDIDKFRKKRNYTRKSKKIDNNMLLQNRFRWIYELNKYNRIPFINARTRSNK